MAIIIPADLTIVTLRRGDLELPQRLTAEHAVAVLRHASDLLKAHANIEFPLGTCEQVVETMPSGGASDAVDEAGYDFLAATYKAGDGTGCCWSIESWRPSSEPSPGTRRGSA